MLRSRSHPSRGAQAQRFEGRADEGGRGELPELKRQLKDLAADVLDGKVERGAAAVVNQLLNTVVRVVEQERKEREFGEMAERLEALEGVLKGRRTG